MQIPLIPKNVSRTDFICRDGEIDFHVRLVKALTLPSPAAPYVPATDWSAMARGVRFSFAASALSPWTLTASEYPEATIRIPLKSGEKSKAEALLSGDSAHVEAETAERLTAEIGVRIASAMDSMAKDAADAGLFLSPFRTYAQIRFPDGTEGFPSAQGVMLPFTSPPHPEFTAVSVTDDTLTIALRFPLRFHRLEVISPSGLPSGCGLTTYVSTPVPLPSPNDAAGSIGSVRTSTGSTGKGFRFASMTSASIRAAVAAPGEHHRFSEGKVSRDVAAPADYLHHTPVAEGVRHGHGDSMLVLAPSFGDFPAFPKDAFRAVGSDADPLDWISDWIPSGSGGLVPSCVPPAWRAASERPSMLMSSVPVCGDVFPANRRHRVGEGRLLAVAEALRPVSSGQLGEFPLYAFSEDGVWALKADASAGYLPSQKLGRHRLAAGHLVCPYLSGTAFLTAHGLYGVEGNRIRLLSPDFKADALNAAEMSLRYDEKGDRLVISSGTETGFHEFSPMTAAAADVGTAADGEASIYAVSDVTDLSQVWPGGMDHSGVDTWLASSGHSCCLLTRPISLSGDAGTCHRAAPACIGRMQVCGLHPDGAEVAAILFGTRDGMEWRPVRLFDPRLTKIVRTLPHVRYRLMLTSPSPLPHPLMLEFD